MYKNINVPVSYVSPALNTTITVLQNLVLLSGVIYIVFSFTTGLVLLVCMHGSKYSHGINRVHNNLFNCSILTCTMSKA